MKVRNKVRLVLLLLILCVPLGCGTLPLGSQYYELRYSCISGDNEKTKECLSKFKKADINISLNYNEIVLGKKYDLYIDVLLKSETVDLEAFFKGITCKLRIKSIGFAGKLNGGNYSGKDYIGHIIIEIDPSRLRGFNTHRITLTHIEDKSFFSEFRFQRKKGSIQ